ncbi:MAG: glycosyltransferase family 2 protein [Acidimicrobiia bacterium]|nr:glycosyltransferase family 2 protein [Acidimicrobiia bacterium]
MGSEPSSRGVTAVVAAYNEAARIGVVLDVLTSYNGFDKVVVVDDGSTDGTREVVGRYPVTYLRVEPNQGKGHAMDVGVQHASTDLIFFADADIIGLTHHMIRETIRPVMDGSCEMFILMRNRKIYYLHLLMAFIPLLGGERALTKDLWLRLPDRYKDRFRIEAGLNFYAIYHGGGLKYHVFKGISQTVKEAKFGFWEGMGRRLKMFRDVISAAWELQRRDVPATVEARRGAVWRILGSVAGMFVGLFILGATLIGPIGFVQAVFAEELSADPDAPFVRFLLLVASSVTTPVLVAVGAIVLGLNALFFAGALFGLLTLGRTREAA